MMEQDVTASVLEQGVLASESVGWSVQYGAETVPGGLAAERSNYGQIVLEHWLHDTLLPKLISGEIRVQDAERFVREVV